MFCFQEKQDIKYQYKTGMFQSVIVSTWTLKCSVITAGVETGLLLDL